MSEGASTKGWGSSTSKACTYQLLKAGRPQSLAGEHGLVEGAAGLDTAGLDSRSPELDSLGMEVAVSYGEGVGVTAQVGSLAVVEVGASLAGRTAVGEVRSSVVEGDMRQ